MRKSWEKISNPGQVNSAANSGRRRFCPMGDAPMSADNRRQKNSWKAARLVYPFFRQYRRRLIVGFLALLSVNFLQLLIPRVIKHAVDALQVQSAARGDLWRYGALVVLLALGIACMRFVWRYFILGFSRQLEVDLRTWMFSHLLTLDRVFFQRRPAGEIMALATNDLASVQLACGMGLVAFADAIVLTIAALAFMAYIHPVLTVLAVMPMPVLAVLTRLLASRLHHRFRKVQERFSKLTEFARSTFSSIRLIKAYTQEPFQAERFDQLGKQYVKNNLQLALVQGVLFPVSGLVGNTSLLIVIFFGGRLTIGGSITTGDFVAFITYLYMLVWPMMALGWVASLFQRGVTSLERIQAVIHERPVLKEPAVARELRHIGGDIGIKGLTFTYDKQKKPALRDINLIIRPGLLGIVGRTGSGKTTLCHLLARFYPVDSGSIFFEGVDVNSLSLTTVRNCISYVPQDVILFSDTIAANIALGRPDARQDQVERAARSAAIHDEIVAMKDGYQSRIGEKGVKLSGGQRQRIALARALLLERPILIIDDGLSAVDMETEQTIIRSIGEFIRGRTCIIVSHRVAPLAEADEIVVLDCGRITEKGTHDRLIINNGFYASIYEQQTRRIAESEAFRPS